MSKKTTTKTNRRSAKNDDVSVKNKNVTNGTYGTLSNVSIDDAVVVDDVKRRKELAKLSQQALVEMVIAKEEVIRTLKNLINTLSDKIASQPSITFPAPVDQPAPLRPQITPYSTPTPSKPWWDDPSQVIMCSTTCEVEA